MSLPTTSERRAGLVLGESPPDSVRLDGVGVRYRVPEQRIGTFKEYVIRLAQRRIVTRDFWALKDVSLSIGRGEAFGIVGKNGAGKSTLLKVVSRVLRPTAGRVRVWGSVAPLLELGAGFHPELSGRENVYLNGTLLGHSRAEVDEQFEWIETFADIGGFMDVPLRTYSSGMVARLGFAVATAWEPDVLILDEIFSVGDEAFQKKCKARMDSFRKGHTTILLVSHAAETVRSICTRAAWLDAGEVRAVGPADDVTRRYSEAVA